jgi:DNA-binding transcriptional regulator YiaG
LEMNLTLHNKLISQKTSSRESSLLRGPSHKSGRDIHPNRCTNLDIRNMKKQSNMTSPKFPNFIEIYTKNISGWNSG